MSEYGHKKKKCDCTDITPLIHPLSNTTALLIDVAVLTISFKTEKSSMLILIVTSISFTEIYRNCS